jgi:hypothetical protein
VNAVRNIKSDVNHTIILNILIGIRKLFCKIAPYIRDNFKTYSESLNVYENLLNETFENKVSMKYFLLSKNLIFYQS